MKPPQPRKPSGGLWIGLTLALVALGAGYLYLERSSSKVTLLSEGSEPASQATVEPQPEAASNLESKEEAGPTPQTGSLIVRANVKGATVFLDGKSLGEAPQSVKELKPGAYQVKVEKAGYKPFEKQVQLTAERLVLRAQLAPNMATLRVTSNVEGASVRLDGKSVGSTPLELKDIELGSHALAVSAEGYDTRTEALELTNGPREVKVDLQKPSAQLQESVEVKHKHRLPMQSCDGVLRTTTQGIEYVADDADQFTVDFSEIERLEFKGKNLNVKIRDGRNYSFTERNGNQAALAAFHDRVKAAMDKVKQASR